MIRPATLVSLILVTALGFGLFKVKYEVQSLEEELLRVNKQIAADQEAIHVLKADWSYLTQPVRLGELAQRHLILQPVTAAQLGSFDTLPLKGDEPGAAQPGDVPIEQVLQAMQLASVKPGVGAQRTAGAVQAKPRIVR